MDEEFNDIARMALINSNMIYILAAAYLLIQRRRRRRHRVDGRDHRASPVEPRPTRSRRQRGHFFTHFKEMKRHDPEQFFENTRMSVSQFDYLLRLLRPTLRRKSSRAVTPEKRLALTLKYLSQGTSMQSLTWEFSLGKSTISGIIKQTCSAIWDALMPLYLPTPTCDRFTSIAEGFQTKWNYPHCIGAIDGKWVKLQCPANGGSQFFNFKTNHSIILMAACDADSRFTMVDVGGYGSQGDLTIFRTSEFGKAIMNNELNVPETKPLPNSGINIPYHFLSDEAFPLKLNNMRPYPERFLSEMKRIFNYRLSRGRRTIENAFGILVSRWRIFRCPISASVETVEAIIKATVCLHNFLKSEELNVPVNARVYCSPNYEDCEDEVGNLIPGQWRVHEEGSCLVDCGRVGSNNAQNDAMEMRDNIAEYFMSPSGEVDWQYQCPVPGGNVELDN